ncbi:MAG: DUF1842 domain-containing protein [Candidatus Electronema sp. V4]|uniref:DUF1842 domain-containing protein n=1 Tax=Candidatus Electronema sp. V4 TaxID=3454756 RepID=UPI00405596AB
MANESLYLVKLDYRPKAGIVGAGSMTLQVSVEPVSSSINGQANGTILEGTQHAPRFTAIASGHMHSTGLGHVTKVGAVSGQAMVSVAPPAIGTYLAPFSASFAVDNDWNGTGKFSVGDYTYDSQVSIDK